MIPRIVLAALIYQPTAEISGFNQIAAVHEVFAPGTFGRCLWWQRIKCCKKFAWLENTLSINRLLSGSHAAKNNTPCKVTKPSSLSSLSTAALTWLAENIDPTFSELSTLNVPNPINDGLSMCSSLYFYFFIGKLLFSLIVFIPEIFITIKSDIR